MDSSEHGLESRHGGKRKMNAENKENITTKGQPARAILKPGTSKLSPRITLRASKGPGKSPGSVRGTPPSKKPSSYPASSLQASLRRKPGSQIKDKAHPRLSSPARVLIPTLRVARDLKVGNEKQRSVQVPASVASKKDNSSLAESSGSEVSSEEDGLPEVALHAKTLLARTNTVQLSNSPKISSGDTLTIFLRALKSSSSLDTRLMDSSSGNELEASIEVGESPFLADGELSDEDPESKMRYILARRERNSRSRRSEIKSVRWDPAIVACGPLASITNKPRLNPRESTKASKERRMKEAPKNMEDGLGDLAQIATELKRVDRKKLQQILDALKNVESSDDATLITRAKKDRKPAKEKEAKHNTPTTIPMAFKSFEGTKFNMFPKKLNPEAPVYRNFADIKARISPQKENNPQGGQWPLNVRRKRPHSTGEEAISRQESAKANKYIPPALRTRNTPENTPQQALEPIWVNTSKPLQPIPVEGSEIKPTGFQRSGLPKEWLLDASLDPQLVFQSPILAQEQQAVKEPKQIVLQTPPPRPAWIPDLQFVQQQNFVQHIVPRGWYPGVESQQNTILNHIPLPEWYPISIVPLPVMPAPQQQINSHFPRPQNKGLLKQLPLNAIPRETDPGRTAKTLDQTWATQVLDKFTRKYPMTGKMQPPEPVPKPTKGKKNATEIQQRLEQLLYYQKEKKAFEQRHCIQTMSEESDSSSDTSNSPRESSFRSFEQVSKAPLAQPSAKMSLGKGLQESS